MKVPSQFPWIVGFVLVAHAVVGLFILGGTASKEQDHEGHVHGKEEKKAEKKHPLEGVAFKAKRPVLNHPFGVRKATPQETLDSLPKKPGGGYTAEDNQVSTSRFPRSVPAPEGSTLAKDPKVEDEAKPTATPRIGKTKPMNVLAEKPSSYKPIKPISKKPEANSAGKSSGVSKTPAKVAKQPAPVTRPRVTPKKAPAVESTVPRVRKIRTIQPAQ